MNKRDLRFLNEYMHSYNYSIYDCYAKPSANKRIAYMETLAYMESMGGTDYRILSHNTFTFTCGFIVNDELYIITKDNLYKIKLYN